MQAKPFSKFKEKFIEYERGDKYYHFYTQKLESSLAFRALEQVSMFLPCSVFCNLRVGKLEDPGIRPRKP